MQHKEVDTSPYGMIAEFESAEQVLARAETDGAPFVQSAECRVWLEQSLHELELTPEQLQQDGSGPDKQFDFLVAVQEQQVVGLAVVFDSYSTWKGKQLYLEDLVVHPQFRNLGIGRQLLQAVQQEAKARNARRVLWQAHKVNENALRFYRSLGAKVDESWVNCSLPV